MMGWNSKPEIFHEDKTHESQKKRLKIIFFYSLRGENTICFFAIFFSKFYERDLSQTQLDSESNIFT